jgi:hypothetical protein
VTGAVLVIVFSVQERGQRVVELTTPVEHSYGNADVPLREQFSES